ncbi:zinc ribbon domain-containing protein [Parageobacillus sp. VR-IP]|uniref:zinc ribbon domain-containing protein n=1 Tax=Parageobacillus sp. VR-IP TaxID=2742205 RepID=UPI002810A643|nr:zinc ribbon domain-containing protein [Parageobacillus sp. VR-IP]
MEYKAAIVGVRMVLVPPKNTSCNCPICEHVAKESRSSRGQFCCRACEYAPPCQQRGCGKYP